MRIWHSGEVKDPWTGSVSEQSMTGKHAFVYHHQSVFWKKMAKRLWKILNRMFSQEKKLSADTHNLQDPSPSRSLAACSLERAVCIHSKYTKVTLCVKTYVPTYPTDTAPWKFNLCTHGSRSIHQISYHHVFVKMWMVWLKRAAIVSAYRKSVRD